MKSALDSRGLTRLASSLAFPIWPATIPIFARDQLEAIEKCEGESEYEL